MSEATIGKQALSARRVVLEIGPLSMQGLSSTLRRALRAMRPDARHAKAALDQAARKSEASDSDGFARLAEAGFYRAAPAIL